MKRRKRSKGCDGWKAFDDVVVPQNAWSCMRLTLGRNGPQFGGHAAPTNNLTPWRSHCQGLFRPGLALTLFSSGPGKERWYRQPCRSLTKKLGRPQFIVYDDVVLDLRILLPPVVFLRLVHTMKPCRQRRHQLENPIHQLPPSLNLPFQRTSAKSHTLDCNAKKLSPISQLNASTQYLPPYGSPAVHKQIISENLRCIISTPPGSSW
jgi:hypothetical protein